MPIRIAFCTHRGSTPGQQDSVLIGSQVHQHDDFESHADLDSTALLLAIADGLAVSPRSGDVSRALLDVFPKAVQNNPQWLRDGLLSNRHLREAHTLLCDRAARQPRLRGGCVRQLLGRRGAHDGRRVRCSGRRTAPAPPMSVGPYLAHRANILAHFRSCRVHVCSFAQLDLTPLQPRSSLRRPSQSRCCRF